MFRMRKGGGMEQIKRIRKQYALSQEAFAELCGVSARTVQRWEAGQSGPTAENMERLATALGVQLSDLYTASPEAPAVCREHPNTDGSPQMCASDSPTARRGTGTYMLVMCVACFLIWIVMSGATVCALLYSSLWGGFSGIFFWIALCGAAVFFILFVAWGVRWLSVRGKSDVLGVQHLNTDGSPQMCASGSPTARRGTGTHMLVMCVVCFLIWIALSGAAVYALLYSSLIASTLATVFFWVALCTAVVFFVLFVVFGTRWLFARRK